MDLRICTFLSGLIYRVSTLIDISEQWNGFVNVSMALQWNYIGVRNVTKDLKEWISSLEIKMILRLEKLVFEFCLSTMCLLHTKEILNISWSFMTLVGILNSILSYVWLYFKCGIGEVWSKLWCGLFLHKLVKTCKATVLVYCCSYAWIDSITEVWDLQNLN